MRLIAIACDVPYEKGRKIIGTTGSGDAWNNERDVIVNFRNQFGTDCENMEDFAVAQICEQFSVPYLAIRIISNTALYDNEPFDKSKGEDCQVFCLDVIRAIKERGLD